MTDSLCSHAWPSYAACKSSYTVTSRAHPALTQCSGAGGTVRRAAAEVALTSRVERFQEKKHCRVDGTCGGKEGGFVSSSRSARATDHGLRMTAKPTQIAAQAGSVYDVQRAAMRLRDAGVLEEVRRRELQRSKQPHLRCARPQAEKCPKIGQPLSRSGQHATLTLHDLTLLLTPPAMQHMRADSIAHLTAALPN